MGWTSGFRAIDDLPRVHCNEIDFGVISILAKSKISRLSLVSVAEQTGLTLTWSLKFYSNKKFYLSARQFSTMKTQFCCLLFCIFFQFCAERTQKLMFKQYNLTLSFSHHIDKCMQNLIKTGQLAFEIFLFEKVNRPWRTCEPSAGVC